VTVRVHPAPTLYVDADACPVKEEVYRVAARHLVPVLLVANQALQLPRWGDVRSVIVGRDFDAADDWIAERVTSRDVVVTSDLPLASRCLAAGARVLGCDGRELTDDSIGGALAMRGLKAELREMGVSTGGPRPLGDRDRSRFSNELDRIVRDVVRVAAE